MQKSLRSLVIVAALTLAIAPSMNAEQMGCNPHPQAVGTHAGVWNNFVYTLRSYFGL